MKEIPLTQGQVAIVDDEDYDSLMKHSWCASKPKNSHTFYARRGFKIKGKHFNVSMHTEVLGRGRIDHIDGNGLNNTRGNLRFATGSQNIANSRKRKGTSSRFKGVCFEKRVRKWMSHITRNRKHKTIALRNCEVAAALDYDKEAIAFFGPFARPNFGHDGHPRFCELTINHPFVNN